MRTSEEMTNDESRMTNRDCYGDESLDPSVIRHSSFVIGRAQRGFTLLEILAAVGIISLLLGTMFGFLINVLDARTRLLERSAAHHAVTVLIDRLESSLMTCVASDGSTPGVVGDNTSLSVLFRSVNLSGAGAESSPAAMLGDLQKLEFRFDETSAVIEAAVSSAIASAGSAKFESLPARIGRLRMRYHDGVTWRESFDSARVGRLPQAVEIAIWFETPGERKEREELEPAPTVEEIDDRFAAEKMEQTFDEDAYMDDLAARGLNEPEPDRRRVIVVPDSAGATTETRP